MGIREHDQPGDRIAGTFHARLNELFDEWERREGRKLRNTEVVTWMIEHGYDLRAPYLSRLRRGERLSPSLRTIEGLARFFDVDSSRLVSEDEAAAKLHKILDDRQVRGIVMRATGLSVENIVAIRDLVDRLRSEQGLPPVTGDDDLDE